ncbi:glycosyltransferase [Bacteroides timonensis]|uniref:glycosyltransferase n=1 Tax=Bacteroides timonensis TaxID=1470345 RepID=UPI0004B9C9F4|nr:glycosyltransferase [Bacteroides timonensis]
MEKWLSFIVPVYNAERYLPECIDSLLNQNFPQDKYEIILFDDSSVDGSLYIAKEYAQKYSNIRVFTHINAGTSETRNAALENAVGEYVWFIDNDDHITIDILPILHGYTQKYNLDILIFDAIRFKGEIHWKMADFAIRDTPVLSGQNAYLGFYYDVVPWNKIFRREFLNVNKLRFFQKLAEDCELSTRCFYHAQRVKAVAVDAYYYRIIDQSVSHDVKNKKKYIYYLLECLNNHFKYMIAGHPAQKFWMRAFVHDIRRIHIWLEGEGCTSRERYDFIQKEKVILKEIMKHLSIFLSIDFIVLFIASFSPFFILKAQRILRTAKKILK